MGNLIWQSEQGLDWTAGAGHDDFGFVHKLQK